MIHEDIRKIFQMNDGATLIIDSSRHSEFEAMYIVGQTNTVVTCSAHGKLGESYEPLEIGWEAEDHAKQLHGDLTSRTPIVEVRS